MHNYKQYIIYLVKLAGIFSLLYFGTWGIIGLSSPVNYYSEFVASYLNFISPLRASLLNGARIIFSIFGIQSYLHDNYILALNTGESIRMVYTCIGFGLMSFWAAFVCVNKGSVRKKIMWICVGLLAIWLINVCRICVLLLALQNGSALPFGWDNHTWFNVIAYLLLILLMFVYDNSFKLTYTRQTEQEVL